MRVLLVKMSSLGDVVHTLPAVVDARRHCPGLVIDWVVEEGFADIPRLHTGVDRVIPIALRRWRRSPRQSGPEFRRFVACLRAQQYDLVIDAQGLLKSAAVSVLARGPVAGFDGRSAREGVASLAYRDACAVPRGQHAVARTRQLFASVLGYPLPAAPGEFGDLHGSALGHAPDDALPQGGDASVGDRGSREILLLHGTTWESKEWPVTAWIELARLIAADGFRPVVSWGDDREQRRASRIAREGGAQIQDRVGLAELIGRMRGAAGAVAVDTGLAHVAAMLGIAQVSVFGSTNPRLTSSYGPAQRAIVSDHLPCIPCLRRTCKFGPDSSKIHPPCFAAASPERVWELLKEALP
jgi:heptosyltransferase-1